MARPLRIEYEGAIYHITSRGNARQDIYADDEDRECFLDYLLQCCELFGWVCHAYCLMSNHYHLMIETPEANLSKGMRHLNGVYTQYYNRRHGRVGHLYQGRFKSILLEKQSHLLELSRYVVLNPVRAEMVRSAKDWRWSSYRATAGLVDCPAFLSIAWLLGCFGTDQSAAQLKYRKFVSGGRGQASPWRQLKNQIYLGSDDFIKQAQRKIDVHQSLDSIPNAQTRGPIKPLEWFDKHYDKKTAMLKAYSSGHFTLQTVGDYFGVSSATVSRMVND